MLSLSFDLLCECGGGKLYFSAHSPDFWLYFSAHSPDFQWQTAGPAGHAGGGDDAVRPRHLLLRPALDHRRPTDKAPPVRRAVTPKPCPYYYCCCRVPALPLFYSRSEAICLVPRYTRATSRDKLSGLADPVDTEAVSGGAFRELWSFSVLER